MSARAVSPAMFEAARLGDHVAIVKLVEQTQPDIRRYARASCRTTSDVEDATQEALWLLSRHVGGIRAVTGLSGWLFRVVQRECLRLARRAGLALQIDEETLDTQFATRPDAVLRLDLVAALESLPTHYREIALMRDVQEMTIDEIANALGLSRQAVKARLHRARLLLRDYLAE